LSEVVGLEILKYSSLPFGQAALKVCLPWASLNLFSFYIVGRRLAQAVAHKANENEKLLARQENLLVIHLSGNRNYYDFFSSPELLCMKLC